MTYFARLELDLQEARASFLRSRHVQTLASFQQKIAPIEDRIAFLRKKLNLEASHGLTYDGKGFAPAFDPATVAPEESEAPEAPSLEAEAEQEPEAEEAQGQKTDEVHEHPELVAHPELSGESIVFADSEVQILDDLEREFNPDFLAVTESAMKTLDRTKIVVTSEQLNIREHIGMIIRPLGETGAPMDIPETYFVQSHLLSEEMSTQVSNGRYSSMVHIMTISPEGGRIAQVTAPTSTRWLLEKPSP